MKTELYDFQRQGVRRINEFDGRALLADEVGLGKTLQSLYWAWKYLPDDPPGPIIVTVPSHLKINWKREAQKHLGLRVEVLYGQRVPEDKLPPENPNQIYVVNYDILCPPHWKSGTAPPADSWLSFLLKQRPRLIIADEGHKLANPSSMRSRAVRKFSRKVEHMIILTGTPLPNKPENLWHLLHMLRPAEYPSKFDFCVDFTHARKMWWGWDFKGARNLDILHRKLLRTVMIRRRKADVLKDLPPIRHSVVHLDVDLTEYREAEEDYMGWLETKYPLIAPNAAKAKELCRLNHLKQLAGELKVPSVVNWVDDLLQETDGKLLMGALHYSVTEPLIEYLGNEAVLVDGRMTDKQKNNAFDRFNFDDRARVLIGNIDAAGTGWSCKSTSDVAVCELPWRPGDLNQFVGRVDGIERGLPGTAAHIRYLVAADTIESDLCQILQTKQGWASLAIDGTSGEAELPVYDQVKLLIKERTGRSKR